MLKLIEGPYLTDLLEQPQALLRTWQRLPEDPGLLALGQRLTEGKYRRVVMTGMGSSLYALCPLHLLLIESGLESHVVETAELIHYQRPLITADSLVIAVSQSGRSAETVALLDLVRGVAPILAVTNDATSPLAAAAEEMVLVHAGPETSVSCKTYVSTLLGLEWLGAILTGQNLAEVRDDLAVAHTLVAEFLAAWRDHVRALQEMLAGVRHLFVVGRGRSMASACTGGLILKESVRFAAEGMSSAAFRHGPFEALRPHVFVAVLAGDERGLAMNRRLVEDIRGAGGRSELVGPGSHPSPFRIPESNARVLPILEILPLQMISLALASLSGHEAGRFELATKVTAVE